MKYRESGMPSEELWDTFFNAATVLREMEISHNIDLLIDIGCGYGTFIIPASTIVKRVVGLDIDPTMIEHCRRLIEERNIRNVELIFDDVSNGSYGAHNGAADYVSLFNILHCEDPIALLQKAVTFLKPHGNVGAIHWKYEKTPRGPSMDIRPKPEQITSWARSAGLLLKKQVDLPPYHYGLIFSRS